MAAIKHERRSFRIETRAEGEARKIVGYAAVFESESNDLGGFNEIVRRGAFKKTIQEADVVALWNHDANYVLGRSRSGTLKLEEDDTGLRIEVTPPDTSYARDLMASIDRGDVDQMSFAFRAIQDGWIKRENALPLRELKEVRLFDVSPVTFPAYEDTVVALRSHLEERTLTDDEKIALKDILGITDIEAAEPPPAGHSVTQAMRMRIEMAERF